MKRLATLFLILLFSHSLIFSQNHTIEVNVQIKLSDQITIPLPNQSKTINEGEIYSFESHQFLPIYGVIQDLFDSFVNSEFKFETGSLNEDIKLLITIMDINPETGTFFPDLTVPGLPINFFMSVDFQPQDLDGNPLPEPYHFNSPNNFEYTINKTPAFKAFLTKSEIPFDADPCIVYYLGPGQYTDLGIIMTDEDENITKFELEHFSRTKGGNRSILGMLPVELVTFNAEAQGGDVCLTWITATEINNRGFEIQRNISDHFVTIGFVEGNGNTVENKQYKYFDESIPANYSGTIKYRLKQVDFDGSFEFSDILELSYSAVPNAYTLKQNYPNPFNPKTTIVYGLPKDSFVSIKVYNEMGELVGKYADGFHQAGTYSIGFNAEHLPSGVYYYTLSVSENGKPKSHRITKKMVLMK